MKYELTIHYQIGEPEVTVHQTFSDLIKYFENVLDGAYEVFCEDNYLLIEQYYETLASFVKNQGSILLPSPFLETSVRVIKETE